MAEHHLAAGVVVIQEGSVLLVREDGTWSLPKGSPEAGEALGDTAVRETLEETGLTVTLLEAAFVTEYKSCRWGRYLQVYFHAALGSPVENRLHSQDPSVSETRFIPLKDLRAYIRFRPWVVPLEQWLSQQCTAYHAFDLDACPAEL